MSGLYHRIYCGTDYIRARIIEALGGRPFDRSYFESLFGRRVDPWLYVSAVQQERMELICKLVPETDYPLLEVGCAEGVLSRRLAEKAKAIVATDLSMTAIRRARNFCTGASNLHYVQSDALFPPFQRRFGVVVCAGVLVYLTDRRRLLQSVEKISRLLLPDGWLILEHMWESGGGAIAGKTIHEVLLENKDFTLTDFVQRRNYAISVFQYVSKDR